MVKHLCRQTDACAQLKKKEKIGEMIYMLTNHDLCARSNNNS